MTIPKLIRFLRLYLKCRTPVLRGQMRDLYFSNLRLEAAVFLVQFSHIELDFRHRILEQRLKFWVWMEKPVMWLGVRLCDLGHWVRRRQKAARF